MTKTQFKKDLNRFVKFDKKHSAFSFNGFEHFISDQFNNFNRKIKNDETYSIENLCEEYLSKYSLEKDGMILIININNE